MHKCVMWNAQVCCVSGTAAWRHSLLVGATARETCFIQNSSDEQHHNPWKYHHIEEPPSLQSWPFKLFVHQINLIITGIRIRIRMGLGRIFRIFKIAKLSSLPFTDDWCDVASNTFWWAICRFFLRTLTLPLSSKCVHPVISAKLLPLPSMWILLAAFKF